MPSYYNYQPPIKKSRRGLVWFSALLFFAGLFSGLYYIDQKLEARQQRQAYWQAKETALADRSVTVIEGWNNQQIAEKLATSQIGFTAKEFLKTANSPEQDQAKYQFLADRPDDAGLEGYLFPDTYRFRASSTPEETIEKMLNNLDSKLTPKMRQDIHNQGKTVYQIITMASLIEKEVRSTKDMKMVSGIFWNRIANGQRLESCATLAYILGENKPQYSYEETRIDSPYNTYINYGLPVGPISNPGIKAIEAAIYPTNNDYNFFLTRPDTGETIFSRTFEEHKANKAKYLQ
ncbi:MAG TPA: endolytic transglycosylase MltG [bacterium]|nr:endolytic transglycosylase MltG [bacterium]